MMKASSYRLSAVYGRSLKYPIEQHSWQLPCSESLRGL